MKQRARGAIGLRLGEDMINKIIGILAHQIGRILPRQFNRCVNPRQAPGRIGPDIGFEFERGFSSTAPRGGRPLCALLGLRS